MQKTTQSDQGLKTTDKIGPFLTIEETSGHPYDRVLRIFENKVKKDDPPCFVGCSENDSKVHKHPSSICIHWCNRFDAEALRLGKPAKRGSCRGCAVNSDEKLKKILGLSV